MVRAEVFGQLFDVGKDVLSAFKSAVTNVWRVQIGDSTRGAASGNPAALWQAPGLLSLPAEPTQGAASCQVLILKSSDGDIAFAARDTRAAAICADMVAGESCLFGTSTTCNANNGRVVTRKTGAVELRSTAGIDLGGNSTDHIALAQKVDIINSNLKTLAQALGAVAVNPSTGDVSGASWAAVIAAADALAGSVSSVASALVKAT